MGFGTAEVKVDGRAESLHATDFKPSQFKRQGGALVVGNNWCVLSQMSRPHAQHHTAEKYTVREPPIDLDIQLFHLRPIIGAIVRILSCFNSVCVFQTVPAWLLARDRNSNSLFRASHCSASSFGTVPRTLMMMMGSLEIASLRPRC